MRRFLSIVGATFLFFVAVVAADAIYARHEARILIARLKQIDTATNPVESSRSMMKIYKKKLISERCERNLCEYQFLLTNGIISALRIAPRAEIKMYVHIYSGALSDIALQYTSAVFKERSPIVWVQEDFCGDRSDISCEHFAIDPHGRDIEQTWNGSIEVGEKATKEQKQATWALNFACMTEIHGCMDISQLQPTVWKLTGAKKISSRMRSTADSIEEASQPLPE